MHLIALHDSAGSGNPLGVSGNYDRLPFAPYFIFKDLITIFIFILVLSMLVFFVPNLLGDSENYVMADPMKTPSAMAVAILCPTIRSYSTKTIDKNDDDTLDPAQDEKEVDESDKGFITLDRQKQEITKKELLDLIESTKEWLAKHKNLKDKQFLKDFRKLVNGMFQAEGHVGGSFYSTKSSKFIPKLCLGQNASDSSLEFMVMLWFISGKNLKLYITRNQSSRFFHITAQSNSWAVVINWFIPYLRFVYGDKYKGLTKLKDIHDLNEKTYPSKRDQFELINLAYTLVDNTQRKINLKDKIRAVIGESDLDLGTMKEYSNNHEPLSILFILGFQLGDGNFYLRIRDIGSALRYIPLITIKQKDTLNNRQLFQDIIRFLKVYKIHARLEERWIKDEDRFVVLLVIESIVNARKYINLIKDHRELMYWKEEQIDLINNVLVIIFVATPHWKEGQLAAIRVIYTNPENERIYDYDHWARRLDEIFEVRRSRFYIYCVKNRSWSVELPKAFNVIPKGKSFSFRTYNNSSEEALTAAIQYRDNLLNEWLLERGLQSPQPQPNVV